MMLRLAVELGITPSSRSRITAGDDDDRGPRPSGPVDEFTAFQRRRGRL
jgi:phage terminase small subunit